MKQRVSLITLGETFWGGYSSIFIDPEGHPWEVAHNPHWTLTADGGVKLNEMWP